MYNCSIVGFLISSSNIYTPPLPTADGERKPAGAFEYIAKIYQTNNLSDLSKIDYKAAYYAIRKGFAQDEIKAAILRFSPDIENRKKGHIDDYLDRTVKNAISR